MKTKILIMLLAISLSNISLSQAISESNLIGNWRAEKTFKSGVNLVTELEVTSVHEFKGKGYIDDILIWTHEGTWKLNGNDIIWIYTKSNIELPDNFQDTDTIISVDKDKYTSKSHMSGNLTIHYRM